MTSLQTRIKQVDTEQGFFMPLSSLQGIIYAFTPGAGAGGSFAQGSFSTASWATTQYNSKENPYLSSINGVAAGLLKDMGKTVVSAGRTFRKIQLVLPRNNIAAAGASGTYVSTGGIGGQNPGTTPVQDYLTGFIELGFDGQNTPAPVAVFGR
jgi:hypothetical protein